VEALFKASVKISDQCDIIMEFLSVAITAAPDKEMVERLSGEMDDATTKASMATPRIDQLVGRINAANNMAAAAAAPAALAARCKPNEALRPEKLGT